MRNYIEIKMNEDFTEGTLEIRSIELRCTFKLDECYCIEEIADWVLEEYPIEDTIYYFRVINKCLEVDAGLSPFRENKFELIPVVGEDSIITHYELKDEKTLRNIG